MKQLYGGVREVTFGAGKDSGSRKFRLIFGASLGVFNVRTGYGLDDDIHQGPSSPWHQRLDFPLVAPAIPFYDSFPYCRVPSDGSVTTDHFRPASLDVHWRYADTKIVFHLRRSSWNFQWRTSTTSPSLVVKYRTRNNEFPWCSSNPKVGF